MKADGAIIITASHNPAQWNGLKFVRPDGTFLTAEQADEVISMSVAAPFRVRKENRRPEKVGTATIRNDSVIKVHLDEVLKHVDAGLIKRSNFKVAMDYCNGTGIVASPYLLEKLGCKVTAINDSPDGKFAHNPEPTTKNLSWLCDFVKSQKADVGFAQDPDADRLAIVSEKGECIGEENTLALAVKHVLSRYEGRGTREEGRIKVVVNLSTSRMIDDIAAEFGARVMRAAVGETNVVNKMREEGALIGGEGNGGVIYPAVNFGRDSFVAIVLILEYMAKSGKRLSELVGAIKQYKMEKIKIEYPKEKIASALGKVAEKFKNEKINTLDGVRIDRHDDWVHIRPSNTEPVVRVIAEAQTQAQAKEAVEQIEALLT